MCTYPSDKHSMVEEFHYNHQSVMSSMDIEDIMLLSRHICISERLAYISKVVPLAFFQFSYPLLQGSPAFRMPFSILLQRFFCYYSHPFANILVLDKIYKLKILSFHSPLQSYGCAHFWNVPNIPL